MCAEEPEEDPVDVARVNGGTASVAVVEAMDKVSWSSTTDTAESDRTLVLPKPIEVGLCPRTFLRFRPALVGARDGSGQYAGNTSGFHGRVRAMDTAGTSGGHSVSRVSLRPAHTAQLFLALGLLSPTKHPIFDIRDLSRGIPRYR